MFHTLHLERPVDTPVITEADRLALAASKRHGRG